MKQDDDIYLTIGIPTFNGSNHLAQVLDSVLSQKVSDRIEILISDNSSTDSTQDISKEYQLEHPELISYYRNEQNVGFDANVDLVVTRARGAFVWLLSDNDLLLDGSIDKVLNVIMEYRESIHLIFVNYDSVYKVSDSLTGNTVCDGDSYFRLVNFKNSLISSNIVSKSRWSSLHMERYHESKWIHLAYSMESMAPSSGGTGYIMKDFLFKKIGASTWGDRGEFIYYGFKYVDIFKGMTALGYHKSVSDSALHAIEDPYYMNIPRARMVGLKVDGTLLREFTGRFSKIPRFWLVDMPLLILPLNSIRMGQTLYRKIFR
ncbi:MAG TPA: glycosyltransferase [Methanomassiliicoccales archaeon]|jgi:glycosyltransferase involved in cell wall biosynthesis